MKVSTSQFYRFSAHRMGWLLALAQNISAAFKTYFHHSFIVNVLRS